MITLDEALEIVALYVLPGGTSLGGGVFTNEEDGNREIDPPTFRQRVAIRKVLRSCLAGRKEIGTLLKKHLNGAVARIEDA